MKSLKVYIDFKSPAAYLALQPTLTLARTLSAVIDWRPIPTKQTALPAEAPAEGTSARHRRVRAIARQRTHLHYAAVQGLPMQFPPLPGETDFALAVLNDLVECRDDYVQAAFKAYWVHGKDLNEPGVVSSLVHEIGAPLPADCDVKAVVSQCHNAALEDGVIDAPGYVIDGQVFIGREHLPWIKQILQGPQGLKGEECAE